MSSQASGAPSGRVGAVWCERPLGGIGSPEFRFPFPHGHTCDLEQGPPRVLALIPSPGTQEELN